MQRPAVVNIFGILNLVFGFLEVVGVFKALKILGLQTATGDAENPMTRIMHQIPAYATLVKWTIPLGILSCALVFIAGVGLLRFAEWGRKLSIAYGIYTILTNIAVTAANFVFVFRPLAQASQASGSPGSPEAVAVIGSIMGGVFVLIYPAILVFFMTRKEIAEAFRPPAAPAVPPAA